MAMPFIEKQWPRNGQTMVAVVFFNPRAGIPLIQARRVATIEGPDRRYATGLFYIISFRMLKHPATLIGHSLTNSTNYESTINQLYNHLVRPSGFSHPCNFFVAHPGIRF
jgi:hypothetical protein